MGTSGRSRMWEVVTAQGHLRSYEPGDLLFVEGDGSKQVFACVAGRIRIFLTTPAGRELLVGVKEPGDEFGELSAIDGRPRSASAASIDVSSVAVLPADRLLQAMQREPELSVEVCQSLSAALRRANERLVTRESNSARVRTGRMLVELASLRMRHSGVAERYELAITQADLAAWIGATRESTARALADFRRAGLVSTSRGRIVVHDAPALSATVAE